MTAFLAHHHGRIASLTANIEALERQLSTNPRAMTPEIVGRFGNLLHDGLRGENPALRQAYPWIAQRHWNEPSLRQPQALAKE